MQESLFAGTDGAKSAKSVKTISHLQSANPQ